MNSKAILLATTVLSIAVSASAVADSFYFRSKGGPVAAAPGAPETSSASISLLSDEYRAGTTISGTLDTSLSNPVWSFAQTPTAPAIGFTTVEGGVTGTAPTVEDPITFQVTATASEGTKTAVAGPASVTVHPILAISGGPVGEIKGTVNTALDAQPAYILKGLIDAATYTLMQSAAPMANFNTQCPGLSFSTTDGKLSGTPTDVCSLENLTVKVKDDFDQAEATSGVFSLKITLPPSNVMAWGANGSGQLGDGTMTQRLSPVSVLGGKTYVQVSIGSDYACGLVNDGTVECWGSNSNGTIGDNTTTNRLTPTPVLGLSGVSKIVAGGSHTCAISSGIVKCWGNNLYGQLGDGSNVGKKSPVSVSGLTGVTAISAGAYHTCAIASNGTYCWGYNGEGQLGDTTTTNKSSPVLVSGLSGASTIVSGLYHTCAVAPGGLYCWGYNNAGQIGIGSIGGAIKTAMKVPSMTGVSALALGFYHTCALSSGFVRCWGQNNNGQIGDGSTGSKPSPTLIPSLSGVTAIATGWRYTCAVASNGVRCWGENSNGQIGNGNTTDQTIPVQVSGLTSGVSAIAAGANSTYAW